MKDAQQQHNAGAGAIQIHGNHNTINHHTHLHDHLHLHTAPASGFALQAPPAPPARTLPRARRGSFGLSPAQREVLALMRPLPKPVRIDVLGWMRCEFGTSLVMELAPRELHLLRGHLAEVRRAV